MSDMGALMELIKKIRGSFGSGTTNDFGGSQFDPQNTGNSEGANTGNTDGSGGSFGDFFKNFQGGAGSSPYGVPPIVPTPQGGGGQVMGLRQLMTNMMNRRGR
jgi:hypothetical protein